MRYLRGSTLFAVALALSAMLAMAAGPPVSASPPAALTAQSGSPTRGGSLTVLLPAGEWPNLDPALDTQDAADASLLDSIYGGLFEFGAQGKIIPAQATGYKFTNGGLGVDIFLRHGLTFSDGTPMQASNVAWSINRVLDPKNACICDTDFAAVKSVKASGPYTVVLTLSRPFAPIIEAFNNTAPDWTVDETALNSMGTTAYGQAPVAAGPFKVVHNTANATLALTANPRYWDAKNYPLLTNLTFTSVGTDQSAYSALQTNEAQVAAGVTTIPLIEQIKKSHSGSLRVVTLPATFYEFVSLNEKAAPFDNILAREALYYATDPQALVSKLYGGLYGVVQSPTAPGEDFYFPTVPGYRTYNPAKAKALVQQLGGLSVDLATTTNSQYWETEVTALASQWKQAGIKVTLVVNTLAETLSQLEHGSWQALDSNWGGTDPALALPTYFESTGPFSGIHDATLDNLINKAAAVTTKSTRSKLYLQISKRLSQQAEAPFFYEKPIFYVTTSAVQGLAKYPFPYFEQVWLKK